MPKIAATSKSTPLFNGLSDEQRERLLGFCTRELGSETVSLFRDDLEAMRQFVRDESTDLFAKIPHGDGQTILRDGESTGALPGRLVRGAQPAPRV